MVLMFFFFLPRTFCTTEPKHLILIDPGFRFSPDAQLFLRRWLMDFLHENIWACCLKSVIDLSKLFTEYILCDRHYIRCWFVVLSLHLWISVSGSRARNPRFKQLLRSFLCPQHFEDLWPILWTLPMQSVGFPWLCFLQIAWRDDIKVCLVMIQWGNDFPNSLLGVT